MPKISLHVEADSAEEFHALMASFDVRKSWDSWKYEPKSDDAAPLSEVKVTEMTAEETTAAIAEEDAAQPVEEKKARKPRGPSKKMLPVAEEAPEEVEHVGTVAVAEEQGNGEVLTRMDLGDTIAGYVRKYGINFAQTDVSKMLQDMFGADVRKKSDVPDDQKSLKQAIATITQATIDNPYNRKVDVNG